MGGLSSLSNGAGGGPAGMSPTRREQAVSRPDIVGGAYTAQPLMVLRPSCWCEAWGWVYILFFSEDSIAASGPVLTDLRFFICSAWGPL